MNLKFKQLTTCMTLALVSLIVLNSCGKDDGVVAVTFESDPAQFCIENSSDTRCFEVDADAFCTANPLDAQCCIATQDVDCYCSTGDNGTTDTESCCLFEYNPTCFCESNPGDAQCQQDFGFASGISQDFENQPTGVVNDDLLGGGPFFRMDDASVSFNGDANIDAVEGDGYITMVHRPFSSTPWDYADFKVGFEDETEDIDLSTYADPHFNIWINTGPDAGDSAAFHITFKGFTDPSDAGTRVDYDISQGYAGKTSTDGEWKLYSIKLSDQEWRRNYADTGTLSDLKPNMKFDALVIIFRPATWAFAGDADSYDFVAHFDAVSITDGPLEQLPWIK